MMSEYVGPVSIETAIQLFHEGNFADCIKCAEKVIEIHPDNAKIYSILGAAYAQSGNRGMAIAAFERSVVLESSSRSHYNLGKAYEQSNRIMEAMVEYKHSVDIDPSYHAAVEALERLSAKEEAPALVEDRTHTPLLLDSAAEEGVSLIATKEPAPVTTVQESPATENDHQVASKTRLDDLQPVGVPIAPIPTAPAPGRMPDLSGLEARARENEAKAKEAQRTMTKAGIIYGVIVGPIGLMGACCMMRLMYFAKMHLLTTAIEGIILGAIVGFWVGYTCGDDMTGAKVGLVAGFVGQGIPSLLSGDIQHFVFSGLLGAVAFGVAGYFIGMMVENSIGQ